MYRIHKQLPFTTAKYIQTDVQPFLFEFFHWIPFASTDAYRRSVVSWNQSKDEKCDNILDILSMGYCWKQEPHYHDMLEMFEDRIKLDQVISSFWGE